MLRFLLSYFFSKDKAIELIENNQENIQELSSSNKHLSNALQTGLKLWSIWKILLIVWWGSILCLLLGGAYIVYIVISKFI